MASALALAASAVFLGGPGETPSGLLRLRELRKLLPTRLGVPLVRVAVVRRVVEESENEERKSVPQPMQMEMWRSTLDAPRPAVRRPPNAAGQRDERAMRKGRLRREEERHEGRQKRKALGAQTTI